MKTSQKTIFAALFALSILTSFKAVASGEGRNGPDESGASIPVTLDRATSYIDFEKALRTCEGQASQLILSQILRQPLSAPSYSKVMPEAHPFIIGDEKMYMTFGVMANSSDSTIALKTILPDEKLTELETKMFNEPNIPRYKVSEEVHSLLISSNNSEFHGGINVITKLNEDTAFDDLGNLNKNYAIVTHFEVTFSSIYKKDSFRMTKLQLDPKEFKQCLQNQLNN